MVRIVLSITLLAASFTGGWYVSRATVPSASQPEEAPVCETLESRATLESADSRSPRLTEAEHQDYLRLKSLEEKYRATPTPEPRREGASLDLHAAAPAAEPVPTPTTHAIAQKSLNEWQKAENRLSEVMSDEGLDEFLKQTQITDFSRALSGSSVARTLSEIGQQVNGNYQGIVQLSDGTGRHFEMKMETRLWDRRNGLSGRVSIELSDRSRVFSRNSSRGTTDAFRKFAGESLALLLEAGPTHYFQLYYLQDRDAYIGNYYSRKAADEFELKGTVRLGRK